MMRTTLIGFICLCGSVFSAFNMPGFDMQVTAFEKGLVNCDASFQTNPLWVSAVPAKPYSFSTGFTLPQTEQVVFARLYFDVWGGTNTYTCDIAVSVNGIALDSVHIGGTADANPVYEPNQICVYGTGYGAWQVAFNDVHTMLRTDGGNNIVNVTISDDAGAFDARTIDATLVAVYEDAMAEHALDFYLAEGDAYIRKSPGALGSPTAREVSFGDVETLNVLSAAYTTLYTYGSAGQNDRLYFNGTQLGGNDVATGSGGVYGPDVVSFDVSGLLAAETAVLYTVDEALTGATAESTLNPKVGFLAVKRAYCPQRLAGDADGDCKVNITDLAMMAANWLQCALVPQTSCD